MRQSLRILLVEDHLSTCAALRTWLSSLGHEVATANSVTSAYAQAETYPFEVLISDLQLPDGDGRELLGKLRQKRAFHAVAITGHTNRADKELSRVAGFQQFLEKPVNVDVLRQILEAAAGDCAEE